MENLRRWFSMIDLDYPKPWHLPLFFKYIGLMPRIETQIEYEHFCDQIFDAESRSYSGDHANVWFHCLLFQLMVYEIKNAMPDGMCDLYSEKFDVFRLETDASLVSVRSYGGFMPG